MLSFTWTQSSFGRNARGKVARVVLPFLMLASAVPLASWRPQERVDYTVLFAGAKSWRQFLGTVRVQRLLWMENDRRATFAEALAQRLRRVNGGLRLLIVAEDWCPDSVNTGPTS